MREEEDQGVGVREEGRAGERGEGVRRPERRE